MSISCNNFLYGVVGNISNVLSPDKAEIQFIVHGNVETALLKTDNFFHNGKNIPKDNHLEKYVKCGMQVKFSCRIFDHSEGYEYGWLVEWCWRHDDSRNNQVVTLTGIINVEGLVVSLKKQQGMLLIADKLGNEHKVHFIASKFYVNGKKLPASNRLSSELRLDDKVHFDAIPCFPEENDNNCEWFATCVFLGERPKLPCYEKCSKKDKGKKNKDEVVATANVSSGGNGSKSDKNDDWLTELEETTETVRSEISRKTEDAEQSQCNKKVERKRKLNTNVFEIVRLHTSNPRNVFVIGQGVLLDTVNDEYGILLGEFKCNVFQTILFHRRNAFLFKMNLAHSKLSEIFIEGDRLRFIAVSAPSQFVTEWIAVQISVVCPPRVTDGIMATRTSILK